MIQLRIWLSQQIEKIRRPSRKELASNVFWQYIIFGLGVVLPLIVAPYVNRVLGPSGVGLLVFCQAFSVYPMAFIEYGFNQYGSREVAILRNKPNQIKYVISKIILSRVYLGIVAIPVAGIAALMFKETNSIYTVANILFMAVVGGYSLEWYQRGMERNKTIAILHIVGRCSSIPAVFIFVHDASHINRLMFISTLAVTVPYIGSMVLAIKERGWVTVDYNSVKSALYDARYFFYLALSSSISGTIISVLMTKLLSTTETGYWAIAMRIQSPFWGIVSPLITATFPRVAMRMSQSNVDGMNLARKLTIISVACAFAMSIVLALIAYPALMILAGDKYMKSLPTIWILCGDLPVIALSSSLSIMYLYPLKMERYILRLVFVSTLTNVVIFVLLYRYISHNAAAVSLLAGEIAKVSYSLTLIRKAYKNISKDN